MKFATVLFLLACSMPAFAADSYQGDITSYNNQTRASNVRIHTPRTLQEIQDLVLDAKKRGVSLRAKGASHSISSIILSEGEYVSSEKLTGIISIQEKEQTVKVKAGTELGVLADELSERGYSLGFAYPAFRGLTIGGLLATGSHGSSRRHVGVSSQNLREITLVDGQGKVRVLTPASGDAFRAAQVNLGLLGIVHDVTLQIYPDFKLRYEFETIPEFLDANGHAQFGPEADSEIVMWSPSLNRAVKYTGNKTTLPENPKASNHLLGDSNEPNLASDRVSGMALAAGQRFSTVNYQIEKKRLEDAFETPFILRDKSVKETRVSYVGRSSKLLLSEFYAPTVTFTQTEFEFAFPLAEADKVLASWRELTQREGLYFPVSRGLFMRFARSAGTQGPLLSHAQRPGAEAEIWVFASIVDYRANNEKAHGDWTQARDRILQELSSRHSLLWHWGKNSDEMFSWFFPAKAYGANFDRFRKQMQEFDPSGIFANSFAKSLGLVKAR